MKHVDREERLVSLPARIAYLHDFLGFGSGMWWPTPPVSGLTTDPIQTMFRRLQTVGK